MSPRFCSISRRVMRELSVACPKASWSISSSSAIATHAPLTTSIGRGRPCTPSTTGSEKGVMRAVGAKRSSSGRVSRGRSVPSKPPPTKERLTDFSRSLAAASASETSTGQRERLTRPTVFIVCWCICTEPSCSCCCAGLASSSLSSQPSPSTSTDWCHSPLIRKGTIDWYLSASGGEKTSVTSACSPGPSVVRSTETERKGVASTGMSK
mmetsp:Transcript_11812/g.31046  ORF Transcript_11812/g.31046 Transcript_11812/m.31046 type:complete len:210 (-) Transcript_11812:968-1597(-)